MLGCFWVVILCKVLKTEGEKEICGQKHRSIPTTVRIAQAFTEVQRVRVICLRLYFMLSDLSQSVDVF